MALATLVTGAAAAVAAAPAAAAITDCTALNAPIRQVVNPTTTANLLTPWASEATGAISSYGFTTDLGAPFNAATVTQTGLSPVRRFYKAASSDFAWAIAGSSAASSLVGEGYADQGTNFFASPAAVGTCSAPVLAMVRSGHRRYALPDGEAALLAQGWLREGIAFHVRPALAPPPPPSGSVFSFAVIPDTQNEVLNTSDQRMPQRVSWLRTNAAQLGLKWVLHVGDLQNWDTADHIQFATNSAWLAPLGTSGIPPPRSAITTPPRSARAAPRARARTPTSPCATRRHGTPTTHRPASATRRSIRPESPTTATAPSPPAG